MSSMWQHNIFSGLWLVTLRRCHGEAQIIAQSSIIPSITLPVGDILRSGLINSPRDSCCNSNNNLVLKKLYLKYLSCKTNTFPVLCM